MINYGFDSITLTELTTILNKKYQIPSRAGTESDRVLRASDAAQLHQAPGEEYGQIGARLEPR